MRSFKSKILLAGLLASSMLLTSCGNSNQKTTLTGNYYTEVLSDASDPASHKRGCDLFVILNADKSIYTIALDDDSPYQCADMQVLWSIKSSGYFNNLGTLGINGIKALTVEKGSDGLPGDTTGDGVIINGMNQDWLVPMNTIGCALVVLALQNAFAKI